MKRSIVALSAGAAMLAASLTVPSKAEAHAWWWIPAAIVGGVVVGGTFAAAAAQPRAAYYGPHAYAPYASGAVYVERTRCRTGFDRYGRPSEICR